MLYIDMHSGVSSDMLCAGLYGLAGDAVKDDLSAALSTLGYGTVRIETHSVVRAGVNALSLSREIEKPFPAPGTHAHVTAASIRTRIEDALLPATVRARSQEVIALLSEAEGTVHGTGAEAAEFHEVGSAASVVTIVASCWLYAHLGITRTLATPLLLGRGTVTCAHGCIEVPVPAVREMLSLRGPLCRDIPYTTGELTTPTGCALVCTLADAFTPRNGIHADTWVYAAGNKYIPGMMNVLRLGLARSSPRTPTLLKSIAATQDIADV